VGVLGTLYAAAKIADPSSDLTAAITTVRDLVADDFEDRENDINPTSWAEQLVNRVPMIFVAQHLAPVARRWKTQINENSKQTALWDTLPELNHNSVVGFGGPDGIGEKAVAVSLEAPGWNDRVTHRLSVTKHLLDESSIPWFAVTAPRGPALSQALWLILFGDLVSVHIARLRNIDPTAVHAIDRVKAHLADV
jgi:glucose/mannose-6-phosphate isomerase